MFKEITVRQAGGSISATIPKDMSDRLKIQAGDTIFLIETEEGILLSPYDPTFKEAFQIYQVGARQYRNALRELGQ